MSGSKRNYSILGRMRHPQVIPGKISAWCKREKGHKHCTTLSCDCRCHKGKNG